MPTNKPKRLTHARDAHAPGKAARPMATEAEARQQRVKLTFAARVRFFRQLRGLTSADAAAAVGISKAMYSQIESAVRAPSLGVIGNLAAALEVSIGDLFGDSAPAFDPIHTRAGQGRPVTLPDYPESVFHWVGGAELGQMRVSAVLCSSLGRSTGELSLQFDGLWIDHVLAGDAVVEVGGRSYHLKAGDTLTYRAEVPMRMVRCSDDLRVVALSARLL